MVEGSQRVLVGRAFTARVTARVAATSFTITSADATDTSIVAWSF